MQKGTFLTLPSLAFLKISVGGDSHLPDINLARLLVGCVGLRHIHLVLESSTIKLRHTLQHEMHPRLSEVTLEGSKIIRLHPAAFKVSSNDLSECAFLKFFSGIFNSFLSLVKLLRVF